MKTLFGLCAGAFACAEVDGVRQTLSVYSAETCDWVVSGSVVTRMGSVLIIR